MNRQTSRLELDSALVRRARRLAAKAAAPVVQLARTHTTTSVERAVLRLAGLAGADAEGIPWVNRLTDAVREDIGLAAGVALPVFDALVGGDHADLTGLAQKAAAGGVPFRVPQGRSAAAARAASRRA